MKAILSLRYLLIGNFIVRYLIFHHFFSSPQSTINTVINYTTWCKPKIKGNQIKTHKRVDILYL